MKERILSISSAITAVLVNKDAASVYSYLEGKKVVVSLDANGRLAIYSNEIDEAPVVLDSDGAKRFASENADDPEPDSEEAMTLRGALTAVALNKDVKSAFAYDGKMKAVVTPCYDGGAAIVREDGSYNILSEFQTRQWVENLSL